MLPYRSRILLTVWQHFYLILLLLLTLIPLLLPPLKGLSYISYGLSIALLCYGSMHEKGRIGLIAIIVAGLVYDISHYLPLGIHSILWLILFSASKGAKRFSSDNGFISRWILTLPIAIGYYGLEWAALSLYYNAQLPLTSLPFLIIITLSLYPFVYTSIQWLEKNFNRRLWHILPLVRSHK